METQPAPWFFKNLDDGQSIPNHTPHTPSHPKKKLCQLTSGMLFSLYWISWPLKMGPIGFPETSVMNYHFTLCNISDEQRSHDNFAMQALVWLHMVRFRAIWFSVVQFSTSYTNL